MEIEETEEDVNDVLDMVVLGRIEKLGIFEVFIVIIRLMNNKLII